MEALGLRYRSPPLLGGVRRTHKRRKRLSGICPVLHVLQSADEALFQVPKCRFPRPAMLVLEGTRERLVGLYREICRFSRDLVGRAVVLDGEALGSGGLGPATLSARYQVVLVHPYK